jgi:hypothetical protein
MTEPASINRPEAQYTSDWTDGGASPEGKQFRIGAPLPLLYGETGGSSEVLIDVDTAHGDTTLNLLGDRVGLTYHITAAVTAGVDDNQPGEIGLTVLHNGAPNGSATAQVAADGPATARVETQVHVPGGLVPTHMQFRLTGESRSGELNVRTLTVAVVGQPD